MSHLTLAVLLATSTGLLAADPPAPPVAAEPPLPPGAVRIGSTQFRLARAWHRKLYSTADGKSLVTFQGENLVVLLDPETGRRTGEIAIPNSRLNDSDYSTKGNLLAISGFLWSDDEAGDTKPTVWLIDAVAGKVLRTLPVADLGLRSDHSIHFTPDGKRLILGMNDQIRVWDVKSGEELIRQKHKRAGDVLAVSPDGKMIAYGHNDVYLWAWEAGEEPKKFASVEDVKLAAFTADSKTLLAAGRTGKVRRFDVVTGREGAAFDLGGHMLKWSFSPDGKMLATALYRAGEKADYSTAVELWDPTTGKVIQRLSLRSNRAANIGWSPDGARLMAATEHRLWVWDIKTDKLLGPQESGHADLVTGFAFGTDGQLFTSSDDHTIRSWDAKTGKPGLVLQHGDGVRDVAVTPDGSLVAGSAFHNDLRVWDAKSGAERFKLTGNGKLSGRRLVKFSADGKRLIAWGDDFQLRIWNMENGKLLAEHRTLPDGITEKQLADEYERMDLATSGAAAISTDGSTFAFCRHKVVQIFDVETGKERSKFETDPYGVASLDFSPDGKRIAIGGSGKRKETRLKGGGTRNTTEPEHRIAVWDITEKKSLWHMMSLGGRSHEVHFSPDGRRLAERVEERVAINDFTLKIFIRDAENGKDQGHFELTSPSWHFAFDRTGKKLAVSNADTTAILYDLESVLKPNAPK